MAEFVIMPPDYNDSFLVVVLEQKRYFLRFTWNELGERWMFGVYDALKHPIVEGIHVVPGYPLTLFCGAENLPGGTFGVITNLGQVGHNDFQSGAAKFVYISRE